MATIVTSNINASILLNDGNMSDSGYNSGAESVGGRGTPRSSGQSQKFPHLRAQLASIARDFPRKAGPTSKTSASGNASLSPVESLSARDSSGTDSEIEGDDKRSWDELRVSSLLVRQVAQLLSEEKEDELKELLKTRYEIDEEALETNMLELMHAHKDDTSGVPFLFLTPTRRPLSRPSSRASSHSFRLAPGPIARPETPTSVVSAPSSPSLLGPIRRPLAHLPSVSPLASGVSHNNIANSYMTAGSGGSPNSSPTLAHTSAVAGAYLASSLPASPLSSPRLLNAKAHEFRPTPRPLSAAASNPSYSAGRRAESPDLWAHGSGALRGTSKLAIASPLIPDMTLLPPGTPPRALTPTSPLRMTSTSMDGDDEAEENNDRPVTHAEIDEENDPFNPFHHGSTLDRNARAFQPSRSGTGDFDADSGNNGSGLAEDSNHWNSYPSLQYSYNENVYGEFDQAYGEDPNYYDQPVYGPHPQDYQPGDVSGEYEYNNDQGAALDGMTPFDVLSSVFGSSLAPSELEEALAQNGYDFERAMQWLIEKVGAVRTAHQQRSPPSAQQNQQAPYGSYVGGGVHVIPRSQAGAFRGGRGGYNGYGMQGRGGFRGNGRPGQGGNRVCRYFLAGECMRADCRFSHDLDRALCRFWLRGTCAKGESCEFLHHLPNESEIQGVTTAMQQTDINDQASTQQQTAHEEFPALGQESPRGGRRGGYGPYADRNRYDPSRTRFAQAAKKPPPGSLQFVGAQSGGLAAQMAGRKEAKAAVGDSVYSRPTVVAPRASPRLKLRNPSLLPTLPTGEAVSKMYMTYRSRALQLGAARNACLSRAADAWRRGDGASAKRFSREGHELNAKMTAEASEAAANLVRERAKLAENAVRARDLNWSDEPKDRSNRGKACGGGYGVCLGVASKDVGASEDGVKLTVEERTEVMLDVHGLHSNEATEVLEEFLMSLERENFFGLAFVVVGEEKHTGTQDPARGASRARLATGIREWLHNWGYPWNERDGIICVDPLTHMQ